MPKMKVLHSLHRPYHCPLWIVKWVCCFYVRRSHTSSNCFQYEDLMTDMYFMMLDWLRNHYPEGCVGIPSLEAIDSVEDYFEQYPIDQRAFKLKDILSKTGRKEGIAPKVYSTYKAISYYNNLATEKLHFVDKSGKNCCWDYLVFRNFRYKCNISKSDRKLYVRQILKYDGLFFISQCLLQKYILKYGLKAEDVIFDFLQKYYPIPRFDYVSRSHQNYYVVRKHWINHLCLHNGVVLRNSINEDSELSELEREIRAKMSIYAVDIKRQFELLRKIDTLYTSYNKIKKAHGNEFVNLYDICSEMRMSYAKFNTFLAEFYESERMKKNIFFINIVSTIDQRKRFYVRETPILMIRIS